MLASQLTALFMFRLVFLAFHGPRAPVPVRSEHGTHHHDAPPAMALALIVLAVGSVVAGYVNLPPALGGGEWVARFLEPSFAPPHVEEAAEHGLELTLVLVLSLVAASGSRIAF